jgi:hypothetical protein
MIKKTILGILLLSSSLLAQKATFIEVISENMIKINYKGTIQRVYLSGIELFSKANRATNSISIDKKEEFKKATLSSFAHKPSFLSFAYFIALLILILNIVGKTSSFISKSA